MSSLDSRVLRAIRDCAGGGTARQIAFYANIPRSRIRGPLKRLESRGQISRDVRPVQWSGRGNGTAFTVEDDRVVYRAKQSA